MQRSTSSQRPRARMSARVRAVGCALFGLSLWALGGPALASGTFGAGVTLETVGCSVLQEAVLREYGSQESDTAEVHWRGEEYELTDLPGELHGGPQAAADNWAAWAQANGYRLDLSDDGRVLLLVEGKRPDKRALKLLDTSLETYDRLLPDAVDLDIAARDAAPPRSSRRGKKSGRRVDAFTPGLTSGETVVLIAVDNQSDYVALLQHLVKLQPDLSEWTQSARGLVGFTLERPLVATWQTKPAGVEEWDPGNELVHRLGTLLVNRDFGVMPHWLKRGLAWTLEIEVRGHVACFPDRNSFVATAEHRSWPRAAKKMAKAKLKSGEGIRLEDLAAWRRGQWDGETAILAWAVSDWLAQDGPVYLAAILHALESARKEGSTTHSPDGAWRTVAGYSLSAQDQAEILADALGEDFTQQWTRGLAKPRRR